MGPILQDRVYEEVQVSQPNHQNLQPDDIVISGMSGTYPNCHNVNELFEKLYAKVDVTVNETSRWNYQHPEAPQNIGMAPDLRTFDAQFFKVYRKLALVMDVLSRKLLEHAYQAIYDAGVSLAELQGKKVGVFVGVGISDSEKSAFYVPYKSNTLGIVGGRRARDLCRLKPLSPCLGEHAKASTSDVIASVKTALAAPKKQSPSPSIVNEKKCKQVYMVWPGNRTIKI
ncbi:Fatty acid synthase [Eumeta japonica]|uniref:Fatty acid synthase n=1 Tax=Eumeta variegata TaxID=151549 RepID=A0A4C1WX21_EUMVA|nr:Fatty acid synthase [Eumeta japonica]